jgi:hypothetical protein
VLKTRNITPLLLGALASAALCFSSPAAALDIPRLDWQPRSDWINVQKDIHPPALGDGKADDTQALQTALNRGANGITVYLPPGVYRITQTLVFHGPGTGSAVVGHGSQTRLVWNGPAGGRMFWSDGIAYSRYVGLSWDGRGTAAVGFDHDAKLRFETEITHECEAFRNFTDFGIRVGHDQKIASAEILYHNCLFENCGTAVGLLTFNDYDNTIDQCEFRGCGTGVISHKSNFYARNSHFENSRLADFIIEAEHGCSIRRCTSVGSKCFVLERNTIAPLTVQDCNVANWTGKDAAILLDGSPALIFDSVFTPAQSPGVSGSAAATPPSAIPVKSTNSKQKLLISHNQPASPDRLVGGMSPDNLYVVPAGQGRGVVTAASQHFLQASLAVPQKVFDAVRDFGAKGDERTDDSAAIQSAINAARQYGRGATAYLATGRYVVSRALSITGGDYTFEGSGFRCGLVWRGKAGEPLLAVSDAQNVTLANFEVGHHDLGPMNHGDDILVASPSGKPCQLVLDGVYAFGMYDKAPDTHGIHFDHLAAGSFVDARHVQGNLRITDCAAANLLFRTSYEGTVTIEGAGAARDGLTGFLTRLATVTRPALRVRDNNSVVMSDFYVESSDQIADLRGDAGQPAGRVTIEAPKLQMSTQEPLFDILGYSGQIYCGQSLFYCLPAEMKIRLSGARPAQMILAGNFWYNSHPAFELSAAARLTMLGNTGASDSESARRDLPSLSSALDDLRRLGQLDLAPPPTNNSASAR